MNKSIVKNASSDYAGLALYGSTAARDLTLAEILNAPKRLNECEERELQTLETAERQGLLTDAGKAKLAELREQKVLVPTNPDLKTLAEWRREDEEFATDALAVMIDNAQQAIGANNLMSEQSLRYCAADLLTDDRYYYLTIADLKIVFQMARRGDFGKTYERINEATIFEWLEEYTEIRTEEADRQSFDAHNSRNRYEMTAEQLDALYQSLKMQPIKTQLPPTNEELRAKAERDRREVAMLYGDTDGQETQETGEFRHETPDNVEMLAELMKAQN